MVKIRVKRKYGAPKSCKYAALAVVVLVSVLAFQPGRNTGDYSLLFPLTSGGLTVNETVNEGEKEEIKSSPVTKHNEPPSERRTTTDTGVDVSDPTLYDTIDLKGDSSTATVMGMATGYDLRVFTLFIGGLRKTGFKGNIILGLAPDVKQDVLEYFKFRRVAPKIQQYANCTNPMKDGGGDEESKTCAYPYNDIKIRWSRFPLQRDWLLECKTCTGPVLIMDVRDSLFQLDPFGPGSPPITGLQVFQEHLNQTTKHWITSHPISKCKGDTSQDRETWYGKPMLCSGTTIGTRSAMLKYLEAMHAEMKVWMSDKKCHFAMNGDDQSIHNYLFYTGQLPFAQSIPNRMGIVNTVGVEGSIEYIKWRKQGMDEGLEQGVSAARPFPGATDRSWIGTQYNLTDDEGFFTQYDGTRSRVIHQADRFGMYYWYMWLPRQPFAQDSMPNNKS